MPTDMFEKRKKDILGKEDKSNIGEWDKKIIPLCNKLNSKKNFYTTSSCAGRVILIIGSERKAPNLFLYVNHDRINFKEFKKKLESINEKNVNFKQEPCGLHVACRNLENAQILLNKARRVGWKKSGIISSKKRFIIEMFGTNKLEFPLIRDGKILVNDGFLKEIVKVSNKNLEKSWKQIDDLRKKV
jgi:tRNA wybutosine-synthesizing protein 3